MSTVRENLIAARALIDTPEKWIKGAWAGPNCYCAFKAVDEAAGGPFLNAVHVLECELPKTFKAKNIGFVPLIQYNDHPDTTHADIMALFDRAIAAQDGS